MIKLNIIQISVIFFYCFAVLCQASSTESTSENVCIMFTPTGNETIACGGIILIFLFILINL
jgi:hypothetical protein